MILLLSKSTCCRFQSFDLHETVAKGVSLPILVTMTLKSVACSRLDNARSGGMIGAVFPVDGKGSWPAALYVVAHLHELSQASVRPTAGQSNHYV